MMELRLKVLCYWARRHEEFQPVGTPILAANFTQNTIMDLQREMLAEDRVDGAEQTALNPGKIDWDDWNLSKTKVLLYFDACLGVDKVPLTYVLRESDVVTVPSLPIRLGLSTSRTTLGSIDTSRSLSLGRTLKR